MNGGQSQADRVLLGVIQEHTDPERDRQIVRLRLQSPHRSTKPQHDASDCPLFRAADEPRLL